MMMARWIAGLVALVWVGVMAGPGWSQSQPAEDHGLLVVYGALAPSREGDTDRREQIFVSFPANLRDRVYIRVYDPEVFGDRDFAYGGTRNSATTFRVFGGEGAFSAADRPGPVEDGARAAPRSELVPVTGPGTLLEEETWTNDRATDGRWVNLTAVRARQGERIGDRVYFRIDVQGVGGDDGNGFSIGASISRDRARVPDGLEMFAYQPTVRWWANTPATQVWFQPDEGDSYTVQSFDAANGTLSLVTDFEDLPVRSSGQDFWSSEQVSTTERNLAISLEGGFETPNDVTLSVFGADGQPLPLSMPPRRAPAPSRPTATGSGSPLADCRSVAFDASQSTGRTALSHLWEFGDGATSPEPVIAHRYEAPGRYTARLMVMEEGARPGRGHSVEVPVHVRNAPQAVPGADIVVAPGQVLAFDGTASVPSDSPIARHRWSFGDGSVAQGARSEKAYDAPGEYRAVLRVEDDSNHPCNFGVATRVVSVNFAPVAEAGTDQTAVVGTPVRFDGSASYDVDGTIEAYQWDMGDGTTLSGAAVSHTYAGSGTYQVTLTVTDSSGVSNHKASDVMTVAVNAPPEPNFAIPSRPVSVSEVARLDAGATADADGEVLSYLWDFGDGATGEGQVVDYAWTRPGLFTVTLTVTDDSGTASATQSTQRLVLVDAAPVADAGPDQFVTASEVVFDGGGSTDSDGGITAWEWDFGDGSTAVGASVRHAYVRPGVYEVALVVRDDSGAPLNTDRDTMQLVINAAPIADAGPPQVVAPGEEFVVSGRASVDPDGEIADYVWEFPDGSSARGVRAAHSIAEPGLHRIRLSVYDNFRGGAAVDESEVLITVNAEPVAVAGADQLIAPGDTLAFRADQSFDPDGALTSYRWEFNDRDAPIDAMQVERAYPAPGVYTAQLVVTDDAGVLNSTSSDDVTIRVNHAPVAEAGAEITSDRLFISLDGSASVDADGDALIYRWDFGDGSPPAYGVNVTHVYPRAGVYPVTLRVDDGTGLSNAQAIDATRVTINARPVADAGGNRDVCSGEPILFDGSGSVDPDGGLLLYSWDFGDGSGSDLVNPTKVYEQPGTYPVTLRIRNETGTERGTAVDRIAALVRQGPIADAGGDRVVCTNQRVRFDGSGSTDSDGAVNAFAWTFGDGGSGRGESPVHIFKRPGIYNVTLTITGEATGSCSPLDTDVAQLTVVAAAELDIVGPDRVAAGMADRFTASLAQLNGATPVRISWDFGDGTVMSGTDVSHSYATPGEYLITLTAELSGANDGCSTLQTVQRVVVNDPPLAEIDGPESVAAGQAVTFDASASADKDGVITRYAWDFGDGNAATGVLAAHTFARPGVYDVKLTIEDDARVGNSRVVDVRQVTVNPAPLAGLKSPPPMCPAVAAPWQVDVPEDTQVTWQFGDGTRATGASVSHAFERPGLYPVLVSLDDGKGLPNSRRSEEIYVRVNATPRALAGPDRVACPGEPVVFDAGSSSDLDGELTAYVWEFSDGVVLEGARVERVFETAADLKVRLFVRDDSGAICGLDTDEARVLINSTPMVDAGPDLSVPVGAAHDVIRFDGTNARDADGQGLRLSWNFGDGTEVSGAVARHRFSAPGAYTVTVKAQDTTGLSCGVGVDTAQVLALPRE